MVRISAAEFIHGGLSAKDGQKIARHLGSWGIDAILVSGGTHETQEMELQPMAIPRGCLVPLAEAVKKVVSIPVAAVGRIVDPEMAEEIRRFRAHGPAADQGDVFANLFGKGEGFPGRQNLFPVCTRNPGPLGKRSTGEDDHFGVSRRYFFRGDFLAESYFHPGFFQLAGEEIQVDLDLLPAGGKGRQAELPAQMIFSFPERDVMSAQSGN